MPHNDKTPTLQSVPSHAEIGERLTAMLAEQLRMKPEEIELARPLGEYGLDSINAINLAGDLEDWLGFQLPSTLLWDYPTGEALANYLAEAVANPDARENPDSGEDLFTEKARATAGLSFAPSTADA
ncbi:acyl carrier protein [Methylocaldum sp. MU1018]